MKERNPIWNSVGLLIGVVIAILAIVRGRWQLPLLNLAVSVWALWIVYSLGVLTWKGKAGFKRHGKKSAGIDRAMAEMVLRHVNYRITDRLKAACPDARWEWMMRDPALFVVQGGTGRIRVYGVPEYDYADITVDQGGKLSCSFITMTPVESLAGRPEPPNRQEQDPQAWYDAHAEIILDQLTADMESRGNNSLLLKEDGSVVACFGEDEGETRQGILSRLPPKAQWNALAELIEQDGLSATVRDSCIAVTW